MRGGVFGWEGGRGRGEGLFGVNPQAKGENLRARGAEEMGVKWVNGP